jgi:uncharacterized membrane protein (TIGR02234 family)
MTAATPERIDARSTAEPVAPTAERTPAGASPAVDVETGVEDDAAHAGAAEELRVRRRARREMTTAVLLALLGGGLVLAVAGRTWAEGTALVHGSHLAVEVTGNTVNKATTAFALLGIAGGLAVLATRAFGRMVVGALVVLAGVGVVGFAIDGASDTGAIDAAAAGKAAVEGVRAVDVTHAVWPWFAAVGGVAIVLAGLLVLVRGRRWPGMSNRYEAPTGKGRTHPAAPRRAGVGNAELWNALDRGEDPTR